MAAGKLIPGKVNWSEVVKEKKILLSFVCSLDKWIIAGKPKFICLIYQEKGNGGKVHFAMANFGQK